MTISSRPGSDSALRDALSSGELFTPELRNIFYGAVSSSDVALVEQLNASLCVRISQLLGDRDTDDDPWAVFRPSFLDELARREPEGWPNGFCEEALSALDRPGIAPEVERRLVQLYVALKDDSEKLAIQAAAVLNGAYAPLDVEGKPTQLVLPCEVAEAVKQGLDGLFSWVSQRLLGSSDGARLQILPPRWQPPLWKSYVDRLRAVQSARVRRHVFLGIDPLTFEPLLLDRDILSEHAYVLGRSGAGKTSLSLMPLVEQLVAGDGVRRPPVIVLDLKGDMAFYQTTKSAALANGRTFRAFTVRQDRETQIFDTFQNLHTIGDSPVELGEVLIQCLSLFHGDEYGAGFYARQHRDLLVDTLNDPARPRSWQALLDCLEERVGLKVKTAEGRTVGQKRQRFRDTQELLSSIRPMLYFDQLTSPCRVEDLDTEAGANVIHMPRVLERGEVVYFWLHSRTLPMTARDIGKSALFSILHAAGDLHDEGKRVQAYVVIDEFQRIAAWNIAQVLQDARSYGIGLVLAHQTYADLRLRMVDIGPTVVGNTRVKQFFSAATPEEIQWLMDMSGEVTDTRATTTESDSYTAPDMKKNVSVGKGTIEYERPALKRNEILDVSNDPTNSIVHVASDAGLTRFQGRPRVVRSLHALSLGEYRRRLNTPWARRARTSPAPAPASTKPTVDPAQLIHRTTALAKLVETKRAAEGLRP